jgi:N-glycosylase/DNA lyase
MRLPEPFELSLVVRSHGFYDLAPWSWDAERGIVSRPLDLGNAVMAVEVAQGDRALAIRIRSAGRPTAAQSAAAREQLRAVFALDEDLSELHALAAKDPRLAWAAQRGAGRLLRSPTVFEDLVKTLCTTNCTWALTRIMVKNLVEKLGKPLPAEVARTWPQTAAQQSFPTAEAMARRPERFFREKIKMGYRAPYLLAIARRVASGKLDPEAWRDPSIPTAELSERIAELPGFGPYATEHLLRLLGRHDGLALDSWGRKKLLALRGKKRATDRAIARWFAPYGRWAGLALWLELTADWHTAGAPQD